MTGRQSGLTPERHQILAESADALKGCIPAMAAAADVCERTLYRWMARGEEAALLLDADDPDPSIIPEAEQSYWRLCQAVKAGKSKALRRAFAAVDKGTEGYDVVKTVTKTYTDDQGHEVTETTVTTSHQFSWQAGMTTAERMYPEWFAQRRGLELSGPGRGPIEHRDLTDAEATAKLMAEFDEMAARLDLPTGPTLEELMPTSGNGAKPAEPEPTGITDPAE